MRIVICSAREAQQHMQTIKFDVAISIVDDAEPKRPHGLAHVPHVLALKFHDSTDGRGPQLEDARTLVTFLKEHVHRETWLIHCYAGISRSTASALVLLGMKFGFDSPELASKLLFLRPQAWPNPQLVARCEDVLGLAHRPLSAQVRIVDEHTSAAEIIEGEVQPQNYPSRVSALRDPADCGIPTAE